MWRVRWICRYTAPLARPRARFERKRGPARFDFLLPLRPALVALLCCACATIPDGRYGVDRIDIIGVEDLDRFALQACLATQERAWLSIDLQQGSGPDLRQAALRRAPPPPAPVALGLDRLAALRAQRVRARLGTHRALVPRARLLRGAHPGDLFTAAEALYGTRTDKNKIELQVSVLEGEPVRVFSASLQGTAVSTPRSAKS